MKRDVEASNRGHGENFMQEKKDLLLEGTRLDTASSVSGWQSYAALIGRGNAVISATGNIGTVTRHAGVRAIKSGRLRWVLCPFGPVVVWLVALVATFIAESLLIRPREVPVPGEEVSLRVVSLRLNR